MLNHLTVVPTNYEPMCETCYVGDKLNSLLDTEQGQAVNQEVMESHFEAAEIGLGRELR
ncbi:hypothetical protein M192_gp078 [Halorubrum tailed phage 8]|uniref:Uncharacterized protein n=1 Tax=Halorubrum tailed phage 8 TaxID=2847109 RepID=R4TF23_9CAUD|nr:hypothetical protein M192_gp078 [Halorubrum tailed phage 8]AGM10801.1 hypothetical protein HRTV8_55 [Halorubrum tailed phage 8]UBF19380.1 hypothetical protein HRTV-19_gp54 [Halorubrum virus HRTV-19]UBF19509.1 hypothetical protein HRTV-23_gp54 [Halorubrum virus HRTV-23]